MVAYEQAYFLEELQLLQLLSCIDNRPVIGFSTSDPATIPEDVWKQVLFSLIQDGWLQPTESGFLIPFARAELLLTIKNASSVCSAVLSGSDSPIRNLYGGEQPVAVEMCGNAYYRIYAVEQKSPLGWLEEAQAFPEHPAEDADISLLFDAFPSLRNRLQTTAATALPFSVSPLAWSEKEDVQLVLDLYSCDSVSRDIDVNRESANDRDSEGHREDAESADSTYSLAISLQPLCRWVWMDWLESSVVLRQEANGCYAALDTPARRQAIGAECVSGQLLPWDGLPLPLDKE